MVGRLVAGARLGRYQVVRFLSEGGMGELYLARARGIGGFEKTVALKRILPRFAGRERLVEMFLDEARLVATLHHPHIVQVFDIGSEAGSTFYAMEYVHGADVSELLGAARDAGRPLPLEAALAIALGVAAGLHHAHAALGRDGKSAGIVHRDVSPSNVLVAFDGAVKITDFGVAKATAQSTETRPGALKGKLAYMSPEQASPERLLASGGTLDGRSDVFSLGSLLHEILTGERLFEGDSDFAILEAIINRDAAPPSSRRPDVPPELDAIVARALARDREQRYASAQELQRDLLRFVRENRLDASPLALEATLRELFGEQVDAWRAAHAGAALPSQGTVVSPTAATELEQQDPGPVGPARAPRRVLVGLTAAGAALGLVIAGLWTWRFSRAAELGAEAAAATQAAAALEPATPPPAVAPAAPIEADVVPAATSKAPSTVPPAIRRAAASGRHREVRRHRGGAAQADQAEPPPPRGERVPLAAPSPEAPSDATWPRPAETPRPVEAPRPAGAPPWDPDSPVFPSGAARPGDAARGSAPGLAGPSAPTGATRR